MTEERENEPHRSGPHPTRHPGDDGNHDHRGPGVRIPPPLVFLLFLAAGLGLQWGWPLGLTESLILRYVGASLCVLAIIALIAVGLMFHQHKTSIKPWKPTTRVLDHGPFAYSRNPVYLGFCFLAVGIGLSQNSLWMTLSFLPAVFVVYHTAILKEERYLEKKFGEEYRRYKAKVRRWI